MGELEESATLWHVEEIERLTAHNAALLSALRESQSILTAGFRPTVEDIERWDAVIKEAE